MDASQYLDHQIRIREHALTRTTNSPELNDALTRELHNLKTQHEAQKRPQNDDNPTTGQTDTPDPESPAGSNLASLSTNPAE